MFRLVEIYDQERSLIILKQKHGSTAVSLNAPADIPKRSFKCRVDILKTSLFFCLGLVSLLSRKYFCFLSVYSF